MDGGLHVDMGRGTVVDLPEAETQRRWALTTQQWPIMHAVLHGVTRDQMMARHRANHIQVVYADSGERADEALQVKAAMFHAMGVSVHLCAPPLADRMTGLVLRIVGVARFPAGDRSPCCAGSTTADGHINGRRGVL